LEFSLYFRMMLLRRHQHQHQPPPFRQPAHRLLYSGQLARLSSGLAAHSTSFTATSPTPAPTHVSPVFLKRYEQWEKAEEAMEKQSHRWRGKTMQFMNIHEAKTHLSKLIARVMAGEEIIIGKAGKPVAKLIPYPQNSENSDSPTDQTSQNSVIVLRDVSKEQAKQEIQALLLSSPTPLDYGQILEKLGLDLERIVQVCEELIAEGIIEFT